MSSTSQRNDKPRFVRHDGGRAAAGYRGETDDCVTRAIAIASGRPYQEIYDKLNILAKTERPRRGKTRSSSRTGVYRRTYERLLLGELGARWTPCMRIGSGCKVHLRREELPGGRLVVLASRHLVAVVDGVIYDTEDPARGGSRCVYGYYTIPERKSEPAISERARRAAIEPAAPEKAAWSLATSAEVAKQEEAGVRPVEAVTQEKVAVKPTEAVLRLLVELDKSELVRVGRLVLELLGGVRP